MTTETFNPASARFDFMKLVSLSNHHVAMAEDQPLDIGTENHEEDDEWWNWDK